MENNRYLPTPMTCPLLRFFALFLPAPLPRPRFLPALLTLVTLFQMCSAVSKNKKGIEKL